MATQLEFWKVIRRSDVQRLAATHSFVFGDNRVHRGHKGQAAAMRGEPNSIGIITKRLPTMQVSAYLTDDDFQQNRKWMSEGLDRVHAALLEGRTLVFPEAGLGTGPADLPRRAPKTFAWLEQQLERLKEIAKK